MVLSHAKNLMNLPPILIVILFFAFTGIAAEHPNATKQHPEVGKQPAPPAIIEDNATFEKLADGFKFTEGPAVSLDGKIYFNDIPNARTHVFDPKTLETRVFREETGRANGLFFTPEGGLLACEGGNRRVTLTGADGIIRVAADTYKGGKLNSPNDVVIDKHGGFYFTDPRYGKDGGDLEQDVMAVYYVNKKGDISQIASDLTKPNGIILSPRQDTLYVADPGVETIWAYRVKGPGKLGPKRKFADVGSDGMTIDSGGNIYVTWTDIIVFAPSGKELARFTPPEKPANCLLVGNELYVTARTGFYRIKLQTFGIQ